MFLFGKQNINAHLQMNKDYKNDYPPFALLKRMYRLYLEEKGIEKSFEEQERKYVLFVFTRVNVSAEKNGRAPQVRFKFF